MALPILTHRVAHRNDLDALRALMDAMYTHPTHVHKGVGTRILTLCENAARSEGFGRMELMSTLSGEPLYRRSGYQPDERIMDDRGGVAVPLLRMSKVL